MADNTKKKKEEPVEEGLPIWMATFADMMTLLFAFFVLLFSLSSPDPVKVSKMQDGMGDQPELKSFNASLLLKPIMLIRTKSDTNVNINEDLWSAIPEYSMEISASTNQGLKQLVEKVVSRLNDL